MSPDAMNSWIEKAKSAGSTAAVKQEGIQVIKRVETRGSIIIDIADKIRPIIQKMFEGVRDDDGTPLQPAHIRGMALNVAQGIVEEQQKRKASA